MMMTAAQVKVKVSRIALPGLSSGDDAVRHTAAGHCNGPSKVFGLSDSKAG